MNGSRPPFLATTTREEQKFMTTNHCLITGVGTVRVPVADQARAVHF
jgi:hypothetical protein